MVEPPEPEDVETVRKGYGEAHPAGPEDVERAGRQHELLSSSPGTTKDRSTTGESHPVDLDEVEGPAIADDDAGSARD
jgi:hypothetical protein